MTPSISLNDKLLVDTQYYKNHSFEHGEIVVFIAPNENMYVKRVIALPGETVKIQDEKLYINDMIKDEPYIKDAIDEAKNNGEGYNLDLQAVAVPENAIFVLGDNRRNSYDSRIMGPVDYDKVIGKVIQIKHK
jgi:signal peptidase I